MVVKYLLESLNANVKLKENDGWNAFMFAAAKGNVHVERICCVVAMSPIDFICLLI